MTGRGEGDCEAFWDMAGQRENVTGEVEPYEVPEFVGAREAGHQNTGKDV